LKTSFAKVRVYASLSHLSRGEMSKDGTPQGAPLGLSPASPLAASPSAEIRLQPFFFCVCRARNAPARWRNVRFSGVGRVRAWLCRKSRTNRRHGRDGRDWRFVCAINLCSQ